MVASHLDLGVGGGNVRVAYRSRAVMGIGTAALYVVTEELGRRDDARAELPPRNLLDARTPLPPRVHPDRHSNPHHPRVCTLVDVMTLKIEF